MKLYNHISEKERQKIEFLLNNNYSIRNIAKELKRYSSTISREIHRNKINIDINIDSDIDNNSNSNSNNKSNNSNKNSSNIIINSNSINNNGINNSNSNKYNEYKGKYSWFKTQCRPKDIRSKNINKIDKYPDLQNYIIDKLNKNDL